MNVSRQIEHLTIRQSVHIYLKKNPAKFHPDPIWNDGAVIEEEQQKQDELRYEIRSWSKKFWQLIAKDLQF